MKHLLIFISLLLVFPLRADDWKLVWSDEFNQDGLPDDQKWTYEEGAVRNHEPQYYTVRRPENAHVEQGNLLLTAIPENYPNPHYDPLAKKSDPANRALFSYTSASLTTEGKASWLYGRFEIRARLPAVTGTWPAFWTLGINRAEIGWPKCGECDIMEYWGRHPLTMTSTLHFFQNGGHHSQHGEIKAKEPLTDFHVYAMEWSADRIDFFLDDKLYHTVSVASLHDGTENAFRKPHYLLLNLALDPRAISLPAEPQSFVIDYVRVYQRP